MKAKFGISIMTGALAVTLAGTALAGPPSAQPEPPKYRQSVQPKYGQPAQPPQYDQPDQGGQYPAQPPQYDQPDQGGQYPAQPPQYDQPDHGRQYAPPDQGGQLVQPPPYDQPDQGGQYAPPDQDKQPVQPPPYGQTDQGGQYAPPDQGGQYAPPDQGGKGSAPTYPSGMIPAPLKAFEIGVNTGYTQGFGDIASGQRVGCLARAGLGLGLNLAYRVSPQLSIGAATQFQSFHRGTTLQSGATALGMTAGLDATWHLMPFRTVDPFVTLGTGYRLLWTNPRGPDNTVLTHGFELAKLNTGLDFRVSKDVALGPMIGADLNMFLWRNPSGSQGNRKIDHARLNTFVYAGLQGRFDVGGARVMPSR